MTFRDAHLLCRSFHSSAILIAMIIFTACAGPDLAGKSNDPARVGMSEVDSGNQLYRRGCHRQSLSHLFRAFELFTSSDNLNGIAMCLNNIGNVYNSLDDIDTAILFYDEAYTTYTVQNDMQGAIHALTNKAAALIAHNRLSEAEDALSAAEKISTQTSLFFPLLAINRGVLLTKKKEFRKAEPILRQAVANVDSENNPTFAAAHFALGTLMIKTDRHEESIPFFQKALRADQKADFQQGIAEDLASIGDAMVFAGKQKEAVSYYKRSLMIYALINKQEKKEEILNKLEVILPKGASELSLVHFFLKKWQKNTFGDTACH